MIKAPDYALLVDVPMYPSTPVEWTKALVAFDTTSRFSNLELIHYIADYLRHYGIHSELSFNEEHTKANLWATLPDSQGRLTGGLVLSGHTDVVPVDGQAWSNDPFTPEIREGKLYGRGTCDMKGFIATVLSLIPQFISTPLREPIHLAFSYDEEVGCLGAGSMLADMQARGLNPSGCIVGEPTSMRPVVAHKSINTYRCVVHGCAAHSSLTPKGTNAIEYAARFICMFRDLTDRIKTSGPFDELFDVPYTTGQTSTIRGGTAVNIVPAECEFELEFRTLPTQSPEEIYRQLQSYINDVLVPQMQLENPQASMQLIRMAASPGMDTAEQEAITQLVRGLTGDASQRKVAYATEGGLFQQAGVPTVICGPGSIEQAHRADEYIELEQLAQCERFLMAVLRAQAQVQQQPQS